MPRKIQISPEMVKTMEEILQKGSRVELLVEHGEVTVVEIKRKKREPVHALNT